jgi:hypothetical protein
LYRFDEEKKVEFFEMCPCTVKGRVTEMLALFNPAVRNVPGITESALTDHVGQSAYITGDRDKFYRLLKHALASTWVRKSMGFRARYVTDQEILAARLGEEVKINDPEESQDSDYSGKATLFRLLESPDLVVIHLGSIKYRNVALPGYLLEGINIRAKTDKATWIYSPHEVSYSDFFYSQELEQYLIHLKRFRLSSDAKPKMPQAELPLNFGAMK